MELTSCDWLLRRCSRCFCDLLVYRRVGRTWILQRSGGLTHGVRLSLLYWGRLRLELAPGSRPLKRLFRLRPHGIRFLELRGSLLACYGAVAYFFLGVEK